MAVKMKLLRIEDQKVFKLGVQELSTLVGYGFVYDDKGYEHGEDLEVCVLQYDGINVEADPKKIEVVYPSEGKNDTNFPVKIRVIADQPHDALYKGYRNIVVKKRGQNLDGTGGCTTGPTTCSLLKNAIRIKPPDD